jgi:hypothetical protein
MRAALLLLIALSAGCATERELALSPPPGVDLSGHWRLNVADSDDPLRLTQALASGYGTGAQDPGQNGGQGGGQRGGRGSRSGAPLIVQQPISIPATIVAELLRWPGAQVEIRQDGGIVTFNSDGDSRVYRPGTIAGNASGHAAKRDHRSTAPPPCGWQGASLVVQVKPEDNQPGFDAQYRASDDGRRLIQVITLQGGRLTGFAMSRVWDRE